MLENLWSEQVFKQTVLLTCLFLVFLGLIFFPFRKKNTHMAAAWASLQSWLFFAPIFFFVLAAGGYWPILLVTVVSILCAKEFFQITGMYHRSTFIWLTYISICMFGYATYTDNHQLYQLIPHIFLGVICLVPIFLNETKNMLQYISLSLIATLFMGWGFLHMGWILKTTGGTYTLIYVILLSEFCDNVSLAISRLFGKIKLVDQITPRRTVEGFIISSILTLVLAWGLRHLLPFQNVLYWLSIGTVATLVGTIGDLILSVIRRDLGVKDVGIFILGRSGFLDRMDRLIFVAPVTYYLLNYLAQINL